MSLLALLVPQKQLPPPDPQCRTYSFPETVQLLRNFDQQVRVSRALHQPTENKPS